MAHGPCLVPHRMRPYLPSDRPFVSQTWVRAMAHAPCFSLFSSSEYFRRMQARVDGLLEPKDTVRVNVATAPDDADIILGYAVRDIALPHVIHMCYVKDAFRRMGLARALLYADGVHERVLECTHWGKHCEAIALKYPGKMIYCPSRLPNVLERGPRMGRSLQAPRHTAEVVVLQRPKMTDPSS